MREVQGAYYSVSNLHKRHRQGLITPKINFFASVRIQRRKNMILDNQKKKKMLLGDTMKSENTMISMKDSLGVKILGMTLNANLPKYIPINNLNDVHEQKKVLIESRE